MNRQNKLGYTGALAYCTAALLLLCGIPHLELMLHHSLHLLFLQETFAYSRKNEFNDHALHRSTVQERVGLIYNI